MPNMNATFNNMYTRKELSKFRNYNYIDIITTEFTVIRQIKLPAKITFVDELYRLWYSE